jgi:hypothetical protein
MPHTQGANGGLGPLLHPAMTTVIPQSFMATGGETDQSEVL